MNRLFLFALTIALSAGAATSIFSGSEQRGLANAGNQQNSAAFRDGMYLAKLDSESARKPHLIAARWTNASDRSAFLAGYESVYGRIRNAYATDSNGNSNSQLIGFHDGVSDGMQHRQSSRQFRLDKTDNYRRADRGEDYRQAYANGYQQAFYGAQDGMFRELSQQASF